MPRLRRPRAGIRLFAGQTLLEAGAPEVDIARGSVVIVDPASGAGTDRLLVLRFRCTHNFIVFAFSSMSCRQTRYPGHPSTFVQSVSLKPRSVSKHDASSISSQTGVPSNSCSEPQRHKFFNLPIPRAFVWMIPGRATLATDGILQDHQRNW